MFSRVARRTAERSASSASRSRSWCRTRSRSVAMRLKASTVGAISTNLVGGMRTEKSPRPNRAALSARARTGRRPRFRMT